jgi:hypothetical protein
MTAANITMTSQSPAALARPWLASHRQLRPELLTGVPAGERGADGTYPEKTVNWYVDQALRMFFQRVHGVQTAAAPAHL